ncbi:MAG TPA: immunoglobulin domain-containing protein [Methylomirabilota bacterium]|nr:immunoglobulin domain-containing protein [Methylomirabilota bacterium]
MKPKKLACISQVAAFAAVAAALTTHAQFSPITLTPESYTHDIVVERAVLQPFTPSTTASMDGGTNNTGATWYEVGYNLDAPETGLPSAGATFTAADLADHSFQMPGSYSANNAIYLNSGVTNGTLTLTTPRAASSLSFLTASGNGPITVGYTLRFANGTTETGTFVSPDWFGNTPIAHTAAGRVNAQTGGFDSVSSENPRLYAVDVAVANSSTAINSIELTWNSGTGRAAVFGVSGSSGAEFTPIAVTGFTYDMVIESAASRPAPLTATTATVDRGSGNTEATLYEQGYNRLAPTSGLPAANSLVTNNAAQDHVYRLASSYTAANAALIDSVDTAATLVFATPSTRSALSFLGMAGSGSVTVDYIITHSDGTTQPGQFVVPDWFNVTPYAFSARGRVNVNSGGVDSVNTENPRFYSIDVSVANTTSPIASVSLNYSSGNGHAVIVALSGTAGAVRPIFEGQPASVNTYVGQSAQLTATVSGTAPITFQWQRENNGTFANVANSGTVTGANGATLSFSSTALSQAGNYQLVAMNQAGSSTSIVVRLNILSSTPDITQVGDVTTGFGGTSPANEPVENAIDGTTTKYLNFGTDGNTAAPFVGPVGLVITPAQGATVVTGIRLFTANDAPDRDPADFILEGSNDGETFTRIAGGALSLPTTRNVAGLEIDPLVHANQEVNFANNAAYTTYRVTFTNVRNNAAANSMQIGEVQLLGVAGVPRPRADIAFNNANNTVTITWGGPGRLQTTTSLANPQWTDVTGASPVTQPATDRMRFFRVVE